MRDCRLSSACNAVRLGVGNGTVRDVSIRGVKVRDTRTAVDFVSSWRRGGCGVEFRDVTIDTLDVESVLLCRIYPNFAKETRIGGITFANVSGRVECPSWITGRPGSRIGRIVFDNVRLPHGVVCLNAPEVEVRGGDFALVRPTPEEQAAWNRQIDANDSFPCEFRGGLYRSIQARRAKDSR